jgi:transglycosylase-like protein with SLT domain/Sel1 repeat-containing protein
MTIGCNRRQPRQSAPRWVAPAMAVVVALSTFAPPAGAGLDETREDRISELREQARAYEHGEGTPRNVTRAIEVYCEAARLGDAEAQYSLGWIYANGRGVRRDDALASLFFEMAAGQGHAYAEKMLSYVGPPAAELPECMRDTTVFAVADPDLATLYDDNFIASTPAEQQAAQLVRGLAPEFQVSPGLALAIIRAESNFNTNARSVKNAQGLMQLIPETSTRFNVKKPFDPAQNVRGGLAYLRWLLAYFQGNVDLVAAAYNAGEAKVERYRGIPPYAETRAYVQRIKRYFGKDSHPFDATVTDPSPAFTGIRNVSH